MAANNIRYGMIGPHVGNVIGGEVAEFCVVALVRSAVGETTVGTVAGKVHGERNVAAMGPMFGPFLEGLASAAMDKDDSRERAMALAGTTEIRENASGLLVKGFAFIIDFLKRICFQAPGDGWRGLEIAKVPWTSIALRLMRGLATEQQR
jgi:hypothetical protein